MPTFQEELERMIWLNKEGNILASERCKVIFPRLEAKKRAENAPNEQGKQKTRLIKELHTPEAYSEWNAEFSRYTEAAGNPIIAQSIMLRLLQQLSSESIGKLAEDDAERI